MSESPLQRLPLGTVDFRQLRLMNQVYVDKTSLIYKLTSNTGFYFLARPRRFGKTLLLRTIQTLFTSGVKEFEGTDIQHLWNDHTYPVVFLNFSSLRFHSFEQFQRDFILRIATAFGSRGFVSAGEEGDAFFVSFENWLQEQPTNSMVILIDEYDAPLTSSLHHGKALDSILQIYEKFFLTLKSCGGQIRFFMATGITRIRHVSLFSAFNNLTDISLEPDYGSLLGYTKEEIQEFFSEHLERARRICGFSSQEALIKKMALHYDGFCFERSASIRVFAPWSVLSFLQTPSADFPSYWVWSAGQPSLLRHYLAKGHELADPRTYAEPRRINLQRFESEYSYNNFDEEVVLTQAGYLTFVAKSGLDEMIVNYPNLEVAQAWASLYTADLLNSRSLSEVAKVDDPRKVFLNAPAEEIMSLINNIFMSLDYQAHPIDKEVYCRSLLQSFLDGLGLAVQVERHNAFGRSDLEFDGPNRRVVFELKMAQTEADEEKCLSRAVEQIERNKYGEPSYGKSLLRIAMVYCVPKRIFSAWKVV